MQDPLSAYARARDGAPPRRPARTVTTLRLLAIALIHILELPDMLGGEA